MKGHAASAAFAILAALAAGPVVAGESGQRTAGNVVVNDVIVREVQVRVPAQRPSTAMPRPFLPDAISRPNQGHFVPPPAERHSATRRSRSRGAYGAAVVGYPVGFPIYPFVFEQPYTFYNPPSYPAAAGIAPTPPIYSSPPGLVAGTPSFATIDCAGASAPCGGLSFDVSPADAQVSVEGIFVGSVDAFFPPRAPLVLAAGVHYIEVRRPGYRTETFEVTIGAGAIVPYQGTLEPLRTR
jgi:hypothetical protein